EILILILIKLIAQGAAPTQKPQIAGTAENDLLKCWKQKTSGMLTSDLEIKKLRKAIKDINRVFQKLRKKGELINPKDKEDLKTIQELYETDLNIQLGTIDENINKEDCTK
ncbi:35713_t:CDS:2, partial [Gigaspora margarita]